MEKQTPENPFRNTWFPMTTVNNGKSQWVCEGVYCLTIQISNLCYIGNSDAWILIDAGMPNSEDMIIAESEELFGKNTAVPMSGQLLINGLDRLARNFEEISIPENRRH